MREEQQGAMRMMGIVFRRSGLFCILAFLILLLVFLPGCGGGDDEDSGGASSSKACEAVGLKVAGGTECSAGSNPSSSSIVELDILDSSGESGICTGVAIDDYAVLTAGHCFISGYQSVTVRSFAAAQSASRVVVHPGFSVRNYQQGGVLVNDAAIVFVPRPLGIAVSPTLLSRAPAVGEPAVVVGYGNNSRSGGAGFIRAGDALVASVTPQHVVIEYQGSQSHPCPGDSGGPLLVSVAGSYAIVGVVSQSDPSVPENTICAKGDITLYTSTQDPSIVNFIGTWVPNAPVV